MSPQLPAFGWKSHSEQTGADALEARAWNLSTIMLAGFTVKTALVQEAPEPAKRALEAIVAHARECTNPMCPVRVTPGITLLVGEDGKFRHDLRVFMTLVVDADGRAMTETTASTTSQSEAISNHYAAVALIAGGTADWKTGPVVPERV